MKNKLSKLKFSGLFLLMLANLLLPQKASALSFRSSVDLLLGVRTNVLIADDEIQIGDQVPDLDYSIPTILILQSQGGYILGAESFINSLYRTAESFEEAKNPLKIVFFGKCASACVLFTAWANEYAGKAYGNFIEAYYIPGAELAFHGVYGRKNRISVNSTHEFLNQLRNHGVSETWLNKVMNDYFLQRSFDHKHMVYRDVSGDELRNTANFTNNIKVFPKWRKLLDYMETKDMEGWDKFF